MRSIGEAGAIIVLVTTLLVGAQTQAQTALGTSFTYQGELSSPGGPVNGLYDLRFKLFDAAVGGTQIGGTLCLNDLVVVNGQVVAILDFGPVFSGNQLFLEIQTRPDTGLDCSVSEGFLTLLPRELIANAPNSIFAQNASNLSGRPSGFYQDATNLISGTLSAARLPIPALLSGVVPASPIVSGTNSSNADGSLGLRGLSTASNGVTSGVRGESASPVGTGVYGLVSAATGNYSSGVRGVSLATTGFTAGVWGESQTIDRDGVGVVGFGGSSTGVYGNSTGAQGIGVYGEAFAISGGYVGRGVAGSGPSGVEGYGMDSGDFLGVGVLGVGSFAGVRAVGNFLASGTKSFCIDHPFDPENRYLVHYSTESPEVLNAYSGNAMLDERGEAVVALPVYFASINKDPRYTLTAVGFAMPMLHVADEISATDLLLGERAGPGEEVPVVTFRIAGGTPDAKVSWRVEAIRNDRWVRTHGAPEEIRKRAPERGTYQHPDLYGQPESKGMMQRAKVTPVAPVRTP